MQRRPRGRRFVFRDDSHDSRFCTAFVPGYKLAETLCRSARSNLSLQPIRPPTGGAVNVRRFLAVLFVAVASLSARDLAAQQTDVIRGKVIGPDSAAVAGVQ